MCLGSNGGTDEEAGSRTVNVRLKHTQKRMRRRRRQRRLIRTLFIFPRLFVGRKPLRRSDFCPNDPIGEARERQVSPFLSARQQRGTFLYSLFCCRLPILRVVTPTKRTQVFHFCIYGRLKTTLCLETNAPTGLCWCGFA